MPTKRLPLKANIYHLKHQAKDLVQSYRLKHLDAFQRIREFHPQRSKSTDCEISLKLFTLSDSQLTIAREYGFDSWTKLRAAVAKKSGAELLFSHHERIEDTLFRQAVDLLDEGNTIDLHKHLIEHPQIINQNVTFEGENYFTHPTLLEFIAENPIRHGKMPANIVEIAKLILDAGAAANKTGIDTTLILVSSGRVARESDFQIALIKLLCEYGANPNHALPSALSHGEFEAVDALVSFGAEGNLIVAAASNQINDVKDLLPEEDSTSQYEALALATQHGHQEIVSLLLAAGIDPNRYNPEGYHSHSTPLHQAAFAGHIDVVRVLIEAGARLNIKDIHHQATALDWAEHAGNTEIVQFLKMQ